MHPAASIAPIASSGSVSFRRGREIDRFDGQRDGHHDHADDRQTPEHIDIGQQIDLALDRLSDPADSTARRVGLAGALDAALGSYLLGRLTLPCVGLDSANCSGRPFWIDQLEQHPFGTRLMPPCSTATLAKGGQSWLNVKPTL